MSHPQLTPNSTEATLRFADVTPAARRAGLPCPTRLAGKLAEGLSPSRMDSLLRVCRQRIASGAGVRVICFTWNGQPLRLSCGPGETFEPVILIELRA